MLFNSIEYALFLPAVLIAYWRLPHRGQNALLLVASYFFYGLFDWRFLGLMLISTVTDFTVGRMLPRIVDDGRRRRIFLISLAVNLGILGFFKYFNFFVDDGARLASALGLDFTTPTLRVLLPVGISFYTFHGISYTFDVYRRQIQPARDFLSFAVFVAFFPQLVAGPIGRAHIQLPQIEQPRTPPTSDEVSSSLMLILIGLFKKVAIADALAPYVNDIHAASHTAGWVSLLVGMYAFALQIYGDFSGYSDIARGSARLLGVALPVNFDQPYLSRNITEFWQRWHISLSTWLRDYLYIPLGGNRRSRLVTYRNLILTMLLGGLWHGAAFTFVLWGAVHGVLLASHRAFTERRIAPARSPSTVAAAFYWAATFTVVAAAFVLFRAASIGEAGAYLRGLVSFRSGSFDGNAVALLLVGGITMFALDAVQHASGDHTVMLSWKPWRLGALVGAMVIAVLIFSGTPPVPFIYFRF